jgi:hypothetical protein
MGIIREQLTLQDSLAQKIQQFRNRQGALEFAELKLQPIIVEGVPVGLEESGRNIVDIFTKPQEDEYDPPAKRPFPWEK